LHCALGGIALLSLLPLIHPARAQTEMREALVITNRSGSDALWSRISELVEVKQRLPPRLAIVQGETGAFESLRKEQGVVAVSEETVPDTALQQLNPTERVFAEAWVLGRQPKFNRPGDGLQWDADGFLPPDPPRPRRNNQ
jgi:hypothetical protein